MLKNRGLDNKLRPNLKPSLTPHLEHKLNLELKSLILLIINHNFTVKWNSIG